MNKLGILVLIIAMYAILPINKQEIYNPCNTVTECKNVGYNELVHISEIEQLKMQRVPVIIFIVTCIIPEVLVIVTDYIATAHKNVLIAVLHESFKNIKQFPRGSIDNRTDVRYNNTIAILVRAVNGGTENGRIQKINNRYGKFAYG